MHVTSFDLVATEPNVVACDMAHLPVDDQSFDVALFSLSLMGTNWTDFVCEAFRILVPG